MYKRILVTHDGSRLASLVIPYAVSIAAAFNAEVFILQVVDSFIQAMSKVEPVPQITDGVETSEMAEEIIKDEKKAALNNLREMKSQFEVGGVSRVRLEVTEGIASEEIVDFAKREKCDLIVMSTHGRSGLNRVLLGSVADHVVRHINCPVLLIRPKNSI